jgi:hypothetical protein
VTKLHAHKKQGIIVMYISVVTFTKGKVEHKIFCIK